MKKQILALILLLFTSKAYGENLTVMFKKSSTGDSMTLISDDPAKKIPNSNIYKRWPSFYWQDGGEISENIGGSSKIWPKIMKDLKFAGFQEILSYFSSEGYLLNHGYQRVQMANRYQQVTDILVFSKPDPKK